MGEGKLGRYCQQKIRWLIPEVWKKWWRKKKKLSEKQKKIARLAGDPRKIDKPDFAKLRNRNKKVI